MGTKLTALRTHAESPAFMPRAAIMVGVGTTITMNITAGLHGGGGSSTLAALIPVAFLIALEALIAVIRLCTWPWWIMAGLPLLLLAAITGWVSWLHARYVCLWTGNPDPEAMLIPFIPDLLIVCGSVALVAQKIGLRDKPRKTPTPTTKPRPTPAKPSRSKTSKSAPKPTPALSAKVLAHLSPAQIMVEETAAAAIAKLPANPPERDVARDYCGGSRGAARRVLARATATRAARPLTAVNGTPKEN